MFGYVTANVKDLNPEELKTYRGLYCGLCRTLKERHGGLSRVSLTYDMTFLILVLSSLYGCADTVGEERCAVHPGKKHTYIVNEFSGYAADMNMALFYNKLLDDWKDDKSLKAKVASVMFKSGYERLRSRYPRQCGVMEECLRALDETERRGIMNADLPAGIFGRLLSEIFIYKEDEYSPALRKAASELGRFIYVMDAWDDLKDDIEKERYNPLTFLSPESVEPSLMMLMASCAETLFTLPINKNRRIIENIVYSGVWLRYAAKKSRESGKKKSANN